MEGHVGTNLRVYKTLDSDVQKILDLSEQMKECFKRLEGRRALTKEQADAVRDAAKQQRWFRTVYLSLLRAAFDPEHKKYIENLNRQARTKG